jgi:hypothetical protein
VAFGGRDFKHYEQNLSACHSELIGILHAIQSYHQFLANGKPFTILTDDSSLKLNQRSTPIIQSKVSTIQFASSILEFRGYTHKGDD